MKSGRRVFIKLGLTILLIISELFAGKFLTPAHGSGNFLGIPQAYWMISTGNEIQVSPLDITLTFSPVADTSISSGNPTANYGLLTPLQIDGSPLENALLTFAVSGINGWQVQKATLRLYNVNPSNKGGDFYATSNAWSETTVNWNNAPAAEGNLLYSLGAVVANTWYEVDLTSSIVGDGTYSLRVSSTSSDGADYSSREGSNPPQLVIIATAQTLTPSPTSIYTSTPTDTPTTTSTPTITYTPTRTFTPAPSATPLPAGYSRFAVIGDYGSGNQAESDVATLVNSWNPDFIVTVGDNNYPVGGADTIDAHIGKDYHEFIYPYLGTYGAGATENRFFPALGNHDWDTNNAQPYLDYFTLPNNERYYDFVKGPIHFFIIDSDSREPDGRTSVSIQAAWLQAQLAASTSAWNIVIMHHPPYSSGANHGSETIMQWPYKAWGADAVMSGNDHEYERLIVDGLPYFINGLGGGGIYTFGTPLAGSLVRYNADWGAMLVEADSTQIVFKFYSRTSTLVDLFTLNEAAPTSTPSPTVTATNTPSLTATFTATNTPLATNTPTATMTSSSTPLPSNTPTPTASPTDTDTPLPTATSTATSTATATPLPGNTSTPTASPTYTNTPLPTSTSTATSTATATPLPSSTPTPLPTSTATQTSTSTPTRTATPTATSTPTPTAIIYLFTDGFESGNFSAWTSVVTGTGGSATVQGTNIYAGNFAARFSSTGGTQAKAYARKNLASSEKNVTVSGAFMIVQEGAANANVPIFRLYDSSGKRLLTLYRQNLSNNQVYVSDGSTNWLASRTMPLNTWVKFDLHVIVAGSGAGTIEVYMNGVLAAQTTAANLGTKGVSSLQIGNDTTKQIFTLYADEITVRK